MVGSAREVPDFVHTVNYVTLIDGFFQFRGGPGAHETALVVRVDVMMTAFDQRFGLFLFHAGSTEGEGEFASTAVG